ncbi:hypothetical protein RCCGEPOP_18233, partial [Rhizobium sp. Pop5]
RRAPYSFYMLFWTFNPQPPATEPPAQPDADDEDESGATAGKPQKDGQAE